MAADPDTVVDLANQWIQLDPDPETRQEIALLNRRKDIRELDNRLRPYLSFGTAGLRAQMEAGFARLNALTIIQASQGLAEYVLGDGGFGMPVVIGRDARHNSEKFARLVYEPEAFLVSAIHSARLVVVVLRALPHKRISTDLHFVANDEIISGTTADCCKRLTAAVFAEKGFLVCYYHDPVHTPLVPFGVKFFNAAVGVMITASHNPAADNGYKVYWRNGCQIIPPHDKGIADSISKNMEPAANYMAYTTGALSPDMVTWNLHSLDSVRNEYFRLLGSTIKLPRLLSPFAYTPMHGVGLQYMREAVGSSEALIVVQEQAEPNANFPTVRFPNPEEDGALDLAITTADKHDVHIIIATDPDADRLAVAEKVDESWLQFTGNQLGVLLASYILSVYRQSHEDLSKLSMLATTVSSQMLSHVASVEGFHFDETLTGFKWLGNRAIELDAAGYDVCFAFEQAIGYMIPGIVRDKDGIAAATLFLAARETWFAEGRTPWQQLQQLFAKYGSFADVDTYVRSPSPKATKDAFARIRGLGTPYPAEFRAGQRVLSWRDLTTGFDSREPRNVPKLPVDPTTEMITVEVENDVRFTVRGSGTEPKIKLYVEGKGASYDEARRKADIMLAVILDEWLPGFTKE